MTPPKLKSVKMTYDPAARDGEKADDITFADLEYIATNDNGGMARRIRKVIAIALLTLAFLGFYWLFA